ncbi:hypothetical protein JTB14_014971 [Gonioctena quinquepunctata]|nr:hypothetical protein JTB14_014971 [Gonioctena quinquepunctata]
MSCQFEAQLKQLESNGPTAKLWLQYHRMVTLVKHFIEAERSGNWDLHLSTVSKMIPFFHAIGHFNYACCSQLYVQDMLKIQEVFSLREYRNFVDNGYFTIRRSDKLWAGIWSDMTIEQVLMRGLKVMGGLTHRGLNDSILMKYIYGLPTMVRISQSLEEFTEVIFSTSEQHVDSRPSRQERDNADVMKLSKWLSQHPPFSVLVKLVSLGTGIVGGPEINCHNAEEIGRKELGIIGKTFSELSFPRKKKGFFHCPAHAQMQWKSTSEEPRTITQWKTQTNRVGQPLDTFLDDDDLHSNEEDETLEDETEDPEEIAELFSEDEESSNMARPHKKLKRS